MNNNNNSKERDLRQKATKIKRISVILRICLIVYIVLILSLAVTYLISYIYDKYSCFSVTVNKYDMLSQGLSLSETEEFAAPISRLEAHNAPECTNISGESIPDNVNEINGEHNGDNYIAYSFYAKNTGEDTLSFKYNVYLANVTMHVDEAIRVKLYVDDESEVFAKTKTNGSGPEAGTTEFLSNSVVTEKIIDGFAPGDTHKFTVVIWLEGNDPECVDNIIGGRLKAEMKLSIVENS